MQRSRQVTTPRTLSLIRQQLFARLKQLRQTSTEFDKSIYAYAFGVSLLEMLTRQPAWPRDIHPNEIATSVLAGSRPSIPEAVKEAWPQLLPIIVGCWDQRPFARPTFLTVIDKLSIMEAANERAAPDQ